MLAELQSIKETFPNVGYVHGKGLVWGIHIVKPGTRQSDSELAFKVVLKSVQKGLLLTGTLGPNNGTIKMMPPLTITEDAIRDGALLWWGSYSGWTMWPSFLGCLLVTALIGWLAWNFVEKDSAAAHVPGRRHRSLALSVHALVHSVLRLQLPLDNPPLNPRPGLPPATPLSHGPQEHRPRPCSPQRHREDRRRRPNRRPASRPETPTAHARRRGPTVHRRTCDSRSGAKGARDGETLVGQAARLSGFLAGRGAYGLRAWFNQW